MNNKKQKSSFDIWKTAEHIKIEAGNWAVNDSGFNNYLLSQKQEFYSQIDQIVKESKSSNNINQLFDNLVNLYKTNKDKASKKVDAILPSKILNSKYTIRKENFEKYGFNFELEGLTSKIDLPEIHNMNDDVLFDIYYKKDKPSNDDYNGFTKIVSDSHSSKFYKENLIKDSILNNDPTGYYYLELKSKTDSNKKIKTKITHIVQTDENQTRLDRGIGLLTLLNTRKDYTNYSNEGISYVNGGWWNENNISLSIDFNNLYNIEDSNNTGAKIKLKYISPEEKQLKTIKEINVPFNSQSRITESIFKGLIDKTNHGIYYVELDVLNQNNIVISTIYSNFICLYEKNDIDNFNINKWAEMYKMIK